MSKLDYFERWKWLDTAPDQEWQRLYEDHRPFNAVLERGPLCDKCGLEVEVLLFDPRIDTENEMREAARRLIEEARRSVEKNAGNRCGHHNLTWAAMT